MDRGVWWAIVHGITVRHGRVTNRHTHTHSINLLVQLLSHVWLFATPWTAAHQISLSSPSPRICSNSCPFSQWCHSTTSSSVTPSSWPQSFPASGSFPVSWLFMSGAQSIYWSCSFSISPSNEYSGLISFRIDWFDWLIFLLSKGLSGVISSTIIWNNQSLGAQLYGPILTSINDYWKNHSFDYTNLCWQSNASVFNILSRLVIAFPARASIF